MVKTDRLMNPTESFVQAFPGLGFRDVFALVTSGEEILMSDPIYLADVYNSRDSNAAYLRENGVFVMDFGGDVSGPVWWEDPYVLMPISRHYTESDYETGPNIVVLSEEVGCDSGSFVFLPVAFRVPQALRNTIYELVDKRNAALLSLPSGVWTALYEQFVPEPGCPATFYRNIILKREVDSH